MAVLKLLVAQFVFLTWCFTACVMGGYLITTPWIYRSGSVQRVNVHLYGTDGKWNITASLKISKTNKAISTAKKTMSGDSQEIIEIQVPLDVKPVRYYFFQVFNLIYLDVEGVSQDGKYRFKNKQVLTIQKHASDNIFIQIEKSTYKPEQTVRMRVIGVNGDLKPLIGKVNRIYVLDPRGIRLRQWDDIDFKTGIANVEMALSKQPELGEWTVHAKYQKLFGKSHGVHLVQDTVVKKTFTIKKYVLSKFEVQIETPSFVTFDSQYVSGTICARYHYGQKVPGEMKARFAINSQKTLTFGRKIDGCTGFSITNKDLGLAALKKTDGDAMLTITVNVTEQATGVKQSHTKNVTIHKNQVKMDFGIGIPKHFKPGFPFSGELEVTWPDGKPANNVHITIEAKNDKGKDLFVKRVQVLNGIVVFEIPDVPNDSSKLVISVWHLSGDEKETFEALPWYSKTSSFLSLKRTTKKIKPGETISLGFTYSVGKKQEKADIHYQLVCGGEIVNSGTRRLSSIKRVQPTIGEGSIEIAVNNAFASSCRLLVYYIRQDGEVVADSMVLQVQEKLRNQVKVKFTQNRRSPGESVQIAVKAAPGSTVALSAVEKSLQKETQDINTNMVGGYFSSKDVGPTNKYKTKKFCYKDKGDEDSSKAFYDSGLIYLSDSVIESRPCLPFPSKPPPPPPKRDESPWKPGGWGDSRCHCRKAFLMSFNWRCPWYCRGLFRYGRSIDSQLEQAEALNLSRKPTLQQANFIKVAETWLWTQETVSNVTGERIITAKVPGSMTSWHLNAFAMSSTHGIGISKPDTLAVFRPFFVSTTLPYAVIRGEKVSIVTTVFSYMTTCTTVLIHLKQTSQFELITANKQRLCICGNEAKSVKHVIKSSELGQIPFTVTVKNVLPSLCKNPSDEPPLGISDTAARVLRVEPEGEPKEYTYSELICPTKGKYKGEVNLDLPKDVIPGSVYATVSLTGDVMGPTLKGYDKIVRLPTGCGEQNMVNFAPNIYVMKYLNSTDLNVDDIFSKAKVFLEKGYEQELTYKRKDGSYSAYGDKDDEGSLWLTSFVLRSFSQARQFVFIDNKEIQSIRKWIEMKQLDNGCFEKHGELFRKELKGGVSTTVTLTAYVLISFMESNVNPKNDVIVKGLKCISDQQNNVTDSYSNAIIAYALTLAEHPDRETFLTRLRTKAIVKDGKMHWEKEQTPLDKNTRENSLDEPFHRSSSINIEMSAYALLAMIGDGSDSDALHKATPIVKWLSNQRNALGGFSSTQDTCVALQALSTYGRYVYGEMVDYMKLHAGHGHPKILMQVEVGDKKSFFHNFRITHRKRLVVQRTQVPSNLLPMKLPIAAFGRGCALFQVDVSYSVKRVISGPSFEMSATVNLRKDKTNAMRTDANEQLCHPLNISICAKWLETDQSGMAVIVVKLVSGFRPDEESLEKLINRKDVRLMRFEIEDNKVVLYFNKIKNVCVSFGLDQTSVVKNMQPATVTAYEYYDTDRSGSTVYTITDSLCQTSNAL